MSVTIIEALHNAEINSNNDPIGLILSAELQRLKDRLEREDGLNHIEYGKH